MGTQIKFERKATTPWAELSNEKRVALLNRVAYLTEMIEQHGGGDDGCRLLEIDFELAARCFIEIESVGYREYQKITITAAAGYALLESAALAAATPATPQTTTTASQRL